MTGRVEGSPSYVNLDNDRGNKFVGRQKSVEKNRGEEGVQRSAPSWSPAARKFGLTAGAIGCALLALGLLPFTLIGAGVFLGGYLSAGMPGERGDASASKERVMTAGMVLAAPLVGLLRCLTERAKI